MGEAYWGLPSLARFIRWLEELVAILSKPFLMVGFIVSMLDLLTQGRLLDNWLIFYGWAAIQAIAVDATFFVVWHKVKKAFMASQPLQCVGYTLLGLALGVVAWAAMDLQSLEQVVGISNVEALTRLNLNPVLLTHLRSLVAVVMGGVVAMISPEDNKTLNTEKKAGVKWPVITWPAWVPWIGGTRLNTVQPVVTPPPVPPIERPKLTIKPSNIVTDLHRVERQVNTEQVAPGRPVKQVNTGPLNTVHLAAVERIIAEWPAPAPAPHETDGYSFSEFSTVAVPPTPLHSAVKPRAERPTGPALVEPTAKKATNTDKKNTPPATGRQLHMVEEATPEHRVRSVLSEHGHGISNRRLATLANVSPATVSKWKEVIEQEKHEAVM